MWIMFALFVTASGGVAATTVPFADKASCEAASQQMGAEISGLKPEGTPMRFYMHCMPMQHVEPAK